MKLSVVIPSYNDPQGLWSTIASAYCDLEQDFSRDEFEIIAVIDGQDDDTQVLVSMRQCHTCKILTANTRTPQMNRHIGIQQAEAPFVFFLDSHVVLSRGFFKRMLQTAEETNAAIVHGGHCFWRSDRMCFGYKMDWRNHFWSVSGEGKPHRDVPYRVCLSGHGAMCVNRQQYFDIGGYWDALKGWGGEEPELNLKCWLLGKTIWMEPRAYHWHFMPLKRQLRDMEKSEAYVRNFLLVAYASGGIRYLDTVHFFFTQLNNEHDTVADALSGKAIAPFQHVYDRVLIEAAEHRNRICAGPFGGDLDKLREFFEAEDIPH